MSTALANLVTITVIFISSLVLLSRNTSPNAKGISLILIILFILARILRCFFDTPKYNPDKQREKKLEERSELSMDPIYPLIRRSYAGSCFPLTQISENPLTALSRVNPVLAHDVFKKRSQDELTASLANSGVAIEFAKKGWGTYAATRRKRGWFSGDETTETIIKPIR